jgi:hypoxanthine phosphoribosyltransferase
MTTPSPRHPATTPDPASAPSATAAPASQPAASTERAGHPSASPGPSIGRIVLTESQIRDRLTEIAASIDADYAGRELVLLGVLKGAMMIMADLSRLLRHDHVEIDWITLSSYGDSTSSSGVIRMLREPDLDLAGRSVLVVDDITDSGLTLSWLLANLGSRGVGSVDVLSLLRKPELVKAEVSLRYLGFDIPADFVVGYGMDYAQRFRNLPYIATLEFPSER